MLQTVIICGPNRFETDVFATYLRSLGYLVHQVESESGLEQVLASSPGSVLVLWIPSGLHELIHLVEGIKSAYDEKAIFVLTEHSLDLSMDSVSLVPCPFRFGDLVRRIRTVAPPQNTQLQAQQ